MHCRCHVKCNAVRCISVSLRPEKNRLSVSQPKKGRFVQGGHTTNSTHIRGYYFTDNYRFSLPVGSFIVLMSPTRTTAQTRVGKWQTRVVRYSKDRVRSYSDPSISRATATEHNKLSAIVSNTAEIATFHTLLHPAGLKAAGHAKPETAHGELTQLEVTEPIPVCTRGSGKLQPELVA